MQQLYVVIQEPKHKWRLGLVSVLWFVRATSRTDAVRQFTDYGPCMGSVDRPYYKRPSAELVLAGNTIRV